MFRLCYFMVAIATAITLLCIPTQARPTAPPAGPVAPPAPAISLLDIASPVTGHYEQQQCGPNGCERMWVQDIPVYEVAFRPRTAVASPIVQPVSVPAVVEPQATPEATGTTAVVARRRPLHRIGVAIARVAKAPLKLFHRRR